MRVVSLLPSATEILDRVGGIGTLVGRSHECDHPPGLDTVPVLTAQRTAYDANAAPGEPGSASDVDAQVRAALAPDAESSPNGTAGSAPSLYTLDERSLAELAPDVVLTQDLCEVCSIDLGTVRRVAADIEASTGHRSEVISLAPETFEGVLDDHLRVGRAIGREDAASRAIFEMRSRWLSAESFVNPYTEGPVVGFLEWTDPLFIAGHWTAQMIERAGGRHPLNECTPRPGAGAAAGMQAGERVAGKSIRVPADAFAATRPEFLVVCPCGLTLDQAWAETERLAASAPWWADLPAVRAGRVAVVDGNQMFNRPGPRLVDAFEWLVGWLNDRPALIPPAFPWRVFA